MSADQGLMRNDTQPTVSGVSNDACAMMMFQTNKKSVFVSYLFWFFISWLSAHRFYNGKAFTALVQIVILLVGAVLIVGGLAGDKASDVAGLGILFVGVWGLWIFIDAFLIPGMVRNYNNRLVVKLSGK